MFGQYLVDLVHIGVRISLGSKSYARLILSIYADSFEAVNMEMFSYKLKNRFRCIDPSVEKGVKYIKRNDFGLIYKFYQFFSVCRLHLMPVPHFVS